MKKRVLETPKTCAHCELQISAGSLAYVDDDQTQAVHLSCYRVHKLPKTNGHNKDKKSIAP